jgi:hypothetical protein
METATEIARSVMEEALCALPPHTAQIEVSAFCQRHTRRLACERVAQAREQAGDRSLWHDREWQPGEPLLDLRGLKLGDNRAWQVALPVLKKLAMPVIRSCGVPPEDAEDVFAGTIASMVKPDAEAMRAIDALVVAEQLPALFIVMSRRRAADFLRRVSAHKRNEALEVALEAGDLPVVADGASAALAEYDLHDILEQSASAVSPAQWEVITRLIVHPSDTHASLVLDSRLMTSLGIDPASSEATRRRRLHDSLQSALSSIRRHLDLP